IVATGSIVGVGFVKTIHYILDTLIYNREFWATHEGTYDHLVLYSFGSNGRLAMHNWFWIGAALMAFRLGLAIFFDGRDLSRALVVLAIVVAAYAIPTSSSMTSYYLGAMFYGTFIVSMVLNFTAILENVDGRKAGRFPWPAGLTIRLALLASVSFIF